MYENILVPVALDHEEAVKKSLAVADKLQSANGKITLLHVIENVPDFIKAQIPGGILDKTKQEIRDKLDDFAKSSKHETGTKIVTGHTSRSILDEAERNGCDCIIIASHRPGLEDYFLGSTAARVVRHAKCAVHIIR
jgi:universal stress protein F